MTNNHFQNVVDDVQSCQPPQRPDRLIDGIAHELQSNPATREAGNELEKAKPRLLEAMRV